LTVARVWQYRQWLIEAYKRRVDWLIFENTGRFPDDKDSSDKEVRAKAKARDPLAFFPKDVQYFTEKQCRDVQRHYDKCLAIYEKRGDIERARAIGKKRWTEDRVNACLGHDVVAKRCSMNDHLWEKWLESGGSLTLKQVRGLIEFDVARSVLYRPTDDPDAQPSPEYVKTLDPDVVKNAYEQMRAASERGRHADSRNA